MLISVGILMWDCVHGQRCKNFNTILRRSIFVIIDVDSSLIKWEKHSKLTNCVFLINSFMLNCCSSLIDHSENCCICQASSRGQESEMLGPIALQQNMEQACCTKYRWGNHPRWCIVDISCIPGTSWTRNARIRNGFRNGSGAKLFLAMNDSEGAPWRLGMFWCVQMSQVSGLDHPEQWKGQAGSSDVLPLKNWSKSPTKTSRSLLIQVFETWRI